MNDPKKSTRRRFLQGGAALDAVDDLLDDNLSPGPLSAGMSSSRSDGFVVKMGRRAMACDFEVIFRAGDESIMSEVAVDVLDMVDRLEDQLTVYRDHSEVSRLNAGASMRPFVTENRLFGLLSRAVELHSITSGAFDITAGPLVKAWGFHRRHGSVPTNDAIHKTLESVGSQWLELDSQQLTVFFRRRGLEINLGGIGKGYALDRCVAEINASGVQNFLLHGGQSSVRASGDRLDGSGEGWRVGVRHPLRPGQRLAEFRLRNQALGTSGSGAQFFHYQGRRYGHILDPRSGMPAEGVLSATAIAPDAATADALATGFYVMGVEQTQEYCDSHTGVAALIVTPGEKSGDVEVHPICLPDESWSLTPNR